MLFFLLCFYKMSKDTLSFLEYINNYNTNNVNMFKTIFCDRIGRIKNSSKSSKRIMNDIGINGHFEFVLFKNTYMDFFTYRMRTRIQ